MGAIEKRIDYEKFLDKNKLVDPVNALIHQLFEEQAIETPEKCAIVFNGTCITYENLNNEANQLANFLISNGLKIETIVGIFLERSIKTIVSILAVLKSGGAFLLIDKSLPSDRINFIIKNSKIRFFLIDDKESFFNIYPEKNIFCEKIIDVNDASIYPKREPKVSISGRNMAYIVYTSGTTGKPKGVVIEHQGIANTLLNQIEILNIKNDDRVLCFSSLSFDAFIWEVFGGLLVGAEIYLTTEKERAHIKSVGFLIQKNHITVATLTPSVLRTIPSEFLSRLRILVSAGEACTLDLRKKVTGEAQFYNAYGPAETSICATISCCGVADNKISLGLPLKNVVIYVLNDNLQKTIIGEIGILYVGGLGLARSYLNNDKLTEKFFIENPFRFDLVDRLYNTGDLVRIDVDGSLRYIGRKDREVKIRGNRVNLNEIQCLLSQYPGIQNSLVTTRLNYKNQRNKIIAIVETDDEVIDFGKVKQYLLRFLPSYMLPAKFVKTKQLPLSHNDKL